MLKSYIFTTKYCMRNKTSVAQDSQHVWVDVNQDAHRWWSFGCLCSSKWLLMQILKKYTQYKMKKWLWGLALLFALNFKVEHRLTLALSVNLTPRIINKVFCIWGHVWKKSKPHLHSCLVITSCQDTESPKPMP